MLPILIKLGPITIYSFGFLLALGIFFASYVVWRQARSRGMVEERIIDTFLLSLFGVIIGGRLVHVFSKWSFFQADVGRILLFFKYPGLSFSGGITIGFITAVAVALTFKLSAFEILDIFSLGLVTATVFGSIGCTLDGCLGNSTKVPLQMIIVSLVLAGFLFFLVHYLNKSISLAKFKRRPGMIFLCYLIFQSLCFLILSKGTDRSQTDFYLLVFAGSLVFFLVRYRDIFAMVKFPSSVLSQIRDYLEGNKNHIEKKLTELKKEDPFEDKSRLLDRASEDSEAQSKAGHERVAALQHQLSMALVQTRKALTKIKIGKYGICENCGKMIDTDRLAAMPTATLCVNCERKRER